ncbi:hypothetical protein AMAG_17498 [Allomyces macrogynus ATCC 38327]|uniref:VPS9 domain-containing protein n=1 Tax=Allomyces macrogynus (strain ATCC 38327) TaxID=578462 RepID=A0A0L0TF99_ALLM3|nr:hypothetical protein AMAG_17498 [Allomyces macrogynus ATCC 38327]|eukprot:KNE73346.1 hypothetical protein AMAG_17498 [Allomyces macrogynus ATCC 38327]
MSDLPQRPASAASGRAPPTPVQPLIQLDLSAPSSPATTAARLPDPSSPGDDDAQTATVDDEAIARLLQQEYDEEARQLAERERHAQMAARAAAAAARRSMELEATGSPRDAYPGNVPLEPVRHRSGSTASATGGGGFSMVEARDVVKTKITDLITLIKSEAQRAGQPLSALQTPTSPSAANVAIDRATDLPLVSPNPATAAASAPLAASGTSTSSTAIVPFDFGQFLEQMRDRRALPLTKYFRSFLREFTKRGWTVTEQVKIVHDFLEFMAVQTSKNELFANASDQELENAREGMEKLLMNKLYPHTFSPLTADDAVKDEVLYKKISILQWVELRHLDVHVDMNVAGPFLRVAQKELLKINDYKAPRDKLICILNSCKVIFGLIKQTSQAETADSFLPLLIFVTMQANPPKLISNVQFITRFRNPAKLQSEAGYYLTHIQGAIHFIESLDHTSLSINKAEFDAAIEVRMAAIDEEEAEARARAVLATLDSSSSGLAPATSAGAASAPSSAPLLSNPRLEQIAATAKKPIELLSRWWQDAVAPSPAPPAPPAPTDHAASFARHAQDSASARATTTAAGPVRAHHELVAVPSPTGGSRIAAAVADEEDYELQLAMAMSASLEEAGANGRRSRTSCSRRAWRRPRRRGRVSAPQEDDLAGFSLQASAAAAAAAIVVLPSGGDELAAAGADPGTATAAASVGPVGEGSAPVEGADAATAGAGYQLLI